MSIQSSIEDKIRQAVAPDHLDIINESYQHNVPGQSETHFKLIVVSRAFDGKSSVARHQMIYHLLSEELAGSVHALALSTYTPTEWLGRKGSPPDSPTCLGGGNTRKNC